MCVVVLGQFWWRMCVSPFEFLIYKESNTCTITQNRALKQQPRLRVEDQGLSLQKLEGAVKGLTCRQLVWRTIHVSCAEQTGKVGSLDYAAAAHKISTRPPCLLKPEVKVCKRCPLWFPIEITVKRLPSKTD